MAIAELVLSHIPPVTVSANVSGEPIQVKNAPVILLAGGEVLTTILNIRFAVSPILLLVPVIVYTNFPET